MLGKRGMGQLSMLELAIIISFGSAVGDPMMGRDVPIVHGMITISVITLFQISLERLINKNTKIEAIMEGTPDLVVENGIIQWEHLKRDNLSKEDLFRSLRAKDVEHLGQIHKAFFETTGAISINFFSPKNVRFGLPVLPEEMLLKEYILKDESAALDEGEYACINCGNTVLIHKGQKPSACKTCNQTTWVKASK
jgi:uncharacterized membrane protein YcaP (DUF421 family)